MQQAMDCSTRSISISNNSRSSSRRRSHSKMSTSSRSGASSSSYLWMMTALILSIIAVDQQQHQSPFVVDALKAPLRPKYTPKTSPKPSKQQHESLMRYANSAVEEGMTTPNAKPSSFQQRMKNMLVQQDKVAKRKKIVATRRRQQQATSSTTTAPPPLVHDISTLEEFKDAVTEQDKLVCCRFYAPWCKACQAVTPGFTALAKKYSNEVKFVQVAVTDDNINLHQGLSVPSIPFVHLYYPNGGGLVEEQKFTRKELKSFQRILHDYVNGSCNLLQKRRISSNNNVDPDETEIVWSTEYPYGGSSSPPSSSRDA